jgi:cardiolipin synthase
LADATRAAAGVMDWILAYVVIGWLIRGGMLLTVLRRQFAPGASIAWLGVVFLHPYIGLLLYSIFGESRLGPGRVRHHQRLLERYAIDDRDCPMPSGASPAARQMMALAKKVGHMPVVCDSAVEFFTDSATTINRLTADIAAATKHVHLLYYILGEDETGERIVRALATARANGVTCRVILDQFASRADFGRHGIVAAMRACGVEVVGALPSSPLRRRDLRNHRKLAVIDDRVAYAGSQNLINPDYGGKRGAPWVDLTGRFTGPVVAEHATIFATDWAFEIGEQLDAPRPSAIAGAATSTPSMPMQVVPTGPISPHESFRRLFHGALDAAQHRLVLTTPYFVPDESTILAVLTAVDRGVDVILIMPENGDSMFTAAAARAHFTTLLDAGVTIHLYQPALVHAKIVNVDDSVVLFGSANLDVRSFHLNFELTTLLYGAEVTSRVGAIQQTYIASSRTVNRAEWKKRSRAVRYFDSAIALISPLL